METDTRWAGLFRFFRIIHGLLGLGAGLYGCAFGLLSLGSAQGAKVFQHSGTAAGWMLSGVCWVLFFPKLFQPGPAQVFWAFASGVLTVLVTIIAWPEFQEVWRMNALTFPGMNQALWLYGVLVWVFLAGALFRLAKVRSWLGSSASQGPPGPADQTGPKRRKFPFFIFFLMFQLFSSLLLVPVGLMVWDGLQVAAFNEKYPPLSNTRPLLGAMPRVVLGKHFSWDLGESGQRDLQMADALAELDSFKAMGIEMVMVQAIGEGVGLADGEEQIQGNAYLAQLRKKGFLLALADWSYPSGLPAALPLRDFLKRHRERILNLASRVEPEVFFIGGMIYGYYRFGHIKDPFFPDDLWAGRTKGTDHELWENHFLSLAKILKERFPAMRIGLAIQAWIPEEIRLYFRLYKKKEIEIFGFLARDLAQLETVRRAVERHFFESDQRLWLVDCYHGWVAGPNRRDDMALAWLSGLVGWAQRNRFDAIFPRGQNAFIQNGLAASQCVGGLAKVWEEGNHKLSLSGDSWRLLLARAGGRWEDPVPDYSFWGKSEKDKGKPLPDPPKPPAPPMP